MFSGEPAGRPSRGGDLTMDLLLLAAIAAGAAALTLIIAAAVAPSVSDYVGAVILAAIGLWAGTGAAILALRERRAIRGLGLAVGIAAVLIAADSEHAGLIAIVLFPMALLGLVGWLVAAGFASVLRRQLAAWPLMASLHALAISVGMLFLGSLLAPDPSVSEAADAGEELRQLHAADQADRRSGRMLLDAGRDRRRLERALEIVRSNPGLGPEAKLHAAIVLLHGSCPAHFRRAADLATAAAQAGIREADGIAQAATDRWLLATGRAQRHKTQLLLIELGRRPCKLSDAILS